MRSTNFFILLLIVSSIFLGGCYYDKAELLYPGTVKIDCTIVPAGFAADVNPLIQSKCATSGCHNAAAAGGVILLTYAQISASSARINQRCVVEKNMPTSGPLPPNEIAAIKCWIDSGSPNN